jgi:general stress protein 26
MPTAHLDTRFSSPDAVAVSWESALSGLADADVYWIVTVRGDGRPHVTPLLAVVVHGVAHFCTGPTEQKAKNLTRDPHCSLLTGCASRREGLDIVVEGTAVRVTDEARLQRLADEWLRKYGEDWRFVVRDGAFGHAPDSLRGADPGIAHVFAIEASTVFAFGRGETYSQTRWSLA